MTGGCEWREGVASIPGTINNFGGTPKAFWGTVTPTFYPTGPRATGVYYENFTNSRPNNPCQP